MTVWDVSHSPYLLDVFFFQVLLTVILFLPQVQELLLLLLFELSQFLSTLLVQSCQLLLEKWGTMLRTGGQTPMEQSWNLKSIHLPALECIHFCTFKRESWAENVDLPLLTISFRRFLQHSSSAEVVMLEFVVFGCMLLNQFCGFFVMFLHQLLHFFIMSSLLPNKHLLLLQLL